jgi:hypothetical protein
MLGVSSVKALLSEYAKSFRIKIDEAALLRDLEHSRVLLRRDGNFSFGYTHYFHYFLARYFKVNLNGPDGDKLRKSLDNIARGLNAGSNGIFLMFVVYLTHDGQLTDTLVNIGDEILSEISESDLTTEVDFFNNRDHGTVERKIASSIDLEANRQRRRESADEAHALKSKSDQPLQMDLFTSSTGYSNNLDLEIKLEYAIECMEILGQILRNFTGSLPGEQKLKILSTTYRLGLRTLRALLTKIDEFRIEMKEEASGQSGPIVKTSDFIKGLEKLLLMFAEIVGVGMFQMISTNVGSAEIEQQAYMEAQKIVGKTDATDLINLAIKLDNSDEYPLGQIRELVKQFESNYFATRMLGDLVVANMHVFDIGREMRQKVVNLLGIRQVTEEMMRSDNRRLK